jgi:hypothetical protein
LILKALVGAGDESYRSPERHGRLDCSSGF